jgi:dipeptidyl aminopeptidase/acylaminoacyl peptidase
MISTSSCEAGMRSASMRRTSLLLAALSVLIAPVSGTAQTGRPMTFMDVQEMNRAGSWAISPDGAMMLYTVTTPDWIEAESQSDVHLVSLRTGVSSSRQLTFTEDKNESRPTWAPDGAFFVFASDRDAGDNGRGNQLYMMRHDGGEARKITDAKEGVSGFEFSPDGQWLVFRSGASGQEQLHSLPTDELGSADADQIPDEVAGIDQWAWSPDGASIYFVRPDSFDEDDKERREKGFTVDVKNMVTSLSNLHVLDLASGDVRQLTDAPDVSVGQFTVSDDGRWVGFSGGSAERYERNITGARPYSDLFLMETATGHVERLTDNYEVGEGGLSFSPDGRLVAFTAPDDLTRYTMTENRAYVREVEDRGGAFRKLGADFDGSIGGGFWSEDSKTYYFNTGVKVTTQLHALDIEDGTVRQITHEQAAMSVGRDEDTGVILINYSDPATPPTVFTVDRLDRVTDRSRWVQLVDVNPQVAELALGNEVEVNWTSTDGKTVGGILVYPVGYQEGQRYPLMVIIHGGPASAEAPRTTATRTARTSWATTSRWGTTTS